MNQEFMAVKFTFLSCNKVIIVTRVLRNSVIEDIHFSDVLKAAFFTLRGNFLRHRQKVMEEKMGNGIVVWQAEMEDMMDLIV